MVYPEKKPVSPHRDVIMFKKAQKCSVLVAFPFACFGVQQDFGKGSKLCSMLGGRVGFLLLQLAPRKLASGDPYSFLGHHGR